MLNILRSEINQGHLVIKDNMLVNNFNKNSIVGRYKLNTKTNGFMKIEFIQLME